MYIRKQQQYSNFEIPYCTLPYNNNADTKYENIVWLIS